MLLEAGEQVLEADRDGATLLVLHLHRRAVEAEQLPHFVHLQRDGTFDDLALDRGAVRAERDEHERVARHAVGERADRGEDRGSAGERDAGSTAGGGGALCVRGRRLVHGCRSCLGAS